MGSSTNGVTRGQLRPYIGSRGPPFIICGLFVFLMIVGYNYWNLSFRFNILNKDFSNLEEKLRTSATRNDYLVKQNEALNEKSQRDSAEIEKVKSLLAKKEEELFQVSNQLRSKEDEINRLNSQIEVLKPEVDKYKQAHDELNIVKDQLDVEIKQLKEKNSALEKIVNNVRVESKQREEEQKIVKHQPNLKQNLDASAKTMEKQLNIINDAKLKSQEQKPEAPLDPNIDPPINMEQNSV